MMTNLFSSFDPTSFIFKLNWTSILLFMIFLPLAYWMIPTRSYLMFKMIQFYLFKELKIILKPNFSHFMLIFISFFFFILMNNFLGLFPYIFTASSHLAMTLSITLPLWLSLMIFGWIMNTTHMFIHLIPQGTPPILMPFMVIIESISNIIRPGTLAIRLSANMIAGHLLLTLMGNSMIFMNYTFLNLMIFLQLLLLMLEFAVAIIQSYVFSILSILYSSEVN
uniref:ATP synthase subunit a n=1 Tax=Leptaulax koreanus TaxID=2607329 RepID=A0A5C0XKP0_9SCAR|nr:ATP synthase F0 subunit 6 [Leptaulax koreanus]QEK77356.1 ATP synthase F0 subunit 6 [Leptaulax koreanus]